MILINKHSILELSLSLSSCNSLNSSQSDVASVNKTPKQISDKSQMMNNIPSACSGRTGIIELFLNFIIFVFT
jgi:hypothetical protein